MFPSSLLLRSLLLCFVLSLCSSSVAGLPFSQANLVVPVVLPYANIALTRVQAVLSLCLTDIAAAGLLPNNTLQLVYSDSGNTPQGSVSAVLDVYNNKSLSASTASVLVAVLGEVTSDNSIALALAASGIGVPTLVPESSSATLSDKTTYTYAIRTSTVVSNLGYGILTVLAQYSWSKFAVIFTDDDDGRGLISNLITNVPATAAMSVYSIPPLSNNSRQQMVADRFITKSLTAIQQAGTRIIILHGAQSPQVIDAAYAAGMLGPPYVWIGTNWCNATTVANLRQRWGGDSSALTGTVCVAGPSASSLAARQDSVGQAWTAFSARLSASAPSLFPTASSVDVGFGNLYDCLYLLATAINNVSITLNGTRPTSATLWTALNAQDFYGVTGHLHWPTNGTLTGDRSDSLPVLNYDAPSATYRVVGQYSVFRSVLNITQAVVWNDGSTSATNVPKDRPNVYASGDTLATSYDSRVLVLAYVMAVFGAWTALILLEQAISTRQQQRKEALIEQQRQRSTARPFAAFVWIGWTAAASIALGGCAVWSMNLICVGSLTLDTVTFKVAAGPVIGCLPLSIALCFIGLMLALTAVQPAAASNQSSGDGDSSEKSSTGIHSTTTRPSNTLSSDTSSTANGLRESRKQKKVRQRRESVQQAVRQLLGWRLILCSLLVALATVTSHALMVNGMHGPFVESVTVSKLAACGLLVWLVGHCPLWMMFYWHQSAFRFLAAFCLAAVLLGSYNLAKDAHVYRFDPSLSTDIPSSSFDPTKLSSLVAVAAAVSVTCLALIIFNVAVLKRGRLLLDHVLEQVHAQQEKLEREAEEVTKKEARLRDELADIRRTLEVVAYCRPIFRPYAVALALANLDLAAFEAAQTDDKQAASLLSSSQQSQQTSSKSRPSQSPSTASTGSKDGDKGGKTAQQPAQSLDVPQGGASPTLSPAAGSSSGRLTSGSGFGLLLTPTARALSDSDKKLLRDRSSSTSGGVPSAGMDASDARVAATASVSLHKADFDLVMTAKSPQSVLSLMTDLTSFFEGSVQSATAAHVSFELVMHSLVGLELMKDAVVRQFTPENMAMWLDIQRYNQLREHTLRKRVARQMHAYYVADGAPFEINVSALTKQTINSEIERMERQPDSQDGGANEVGCWLWSEVESELVRLIFSNQWEQFTSSPAYKLVLLTLAYQQTQQAQRAKATPAALATGGSSASNVSMSEVVRVLQQQEAATLFGHQAVSDPSVARTPTLAGSPLLGARLTGATGSSRARSSTNARPAGSGLGTPTQFLPSPVPLFDAGRSSSSPADAGRTRSVMKLYSPLQGSMESNHAEDSSNSASGDVDSIDDGPATPSQPPVLELEKGVGAASPRQLLQPAELISPVPLPVDNGAAMDEVQPLTEAGTVTAVAGVGDEQDLTKNVAQAGNSGVMTGADEHDAPRESPQPTRASVGEGGDVDWEDFGIGNK